MRYFMATTLLLLLFGFLVACRQPLATSQQPASVPATMRLTATQVPGCIMNDSKRAVDLMGKYAQEWDDAVTLATNSSRISLAGPVGQLQRIRRDVQGQAWPECARRAQSALVEAMDYTIDGFTGFMGDRSTYQHDMDEADGAYQKYSRELAVMTGGPTPVPIPTTDRPSLNATSDVTAQEECLGQRWEVDSWWAEWAPSWSGPREAS